MAPGGGAEQPQPPAAFRLVAADELGLLKVIEVPAGTKWEEACVVAKWGEPSRSNGITALCSAASNQEPGTSSLLAVGRSAGRVQLLDGATGAKLAAWQLAGAAAGGSSNVIGLHFLGTPPASGGTQGVRVLSVTGGGRVALHRATAADSDCPFEEEGSFQTSSMIAATAVSSSGGVLAVGGEGCQLSLWDIATQTRAWQAKGAKPNAIGLVDPANITAAAFVGNHPPSARSGGEDSGAACSVGRQVVVVGNAAHKLLLYDTAAGRRPQLEVAWRDARVTALVADDSGRRVWAANGAGAVEALDLRAGRMSGTLKGAAGSVRALALHPWGQPLIASAGLDRFVRIHSTATRANLGRAYIKQQLTAVAWLPPLAPAPIVPSSEAPPKSVKKSKRKQQQQEEGSSEDEGDSSDAETSSDSSGSDAEDRGRSVRQHSSRSGGTGSSGKRKHRGGGVGGKAKHGGKKRR